MNNAFCVAAGLVAMSASNHFFPQLSVVINFAVVHHPDGLILVGKGLVSGREIDDAEPAHSQSHVAR